MVFQGEQAVADEDPFQRHDSRRSPSGCGERIQVVPKTIDVNRRSPTRLDLRGGRPPQVGIRGQVDRQGAARSAAGPQAQRDTRRRLERDQGPESGSAARTEAKGAVQPTMPPCARTISSVASLKAAK